MNSPLPIAGRVGGSVKDFVDRKARRQDNASPFDKADARHGFEDLKVPTGMNQTITKVIKAEKPPDVDYHAKIKTEPVEQRPFYDTDASSVGTTSVMGAADFATQPGLDKNNDTHREEDEQASGDEESEERNDDGAEFEQQTEDQMIVDPVGGIRPFQTQSELMQRFDARFGKWVPLPPIKGDSYPDTTSGNPSPAVSISGQTRLDRENKKMHRKSKAQHLPPEARDQHETRAAPGDQSTERNTLQSGLLVRPTAAGNQFSQQDNGSGFTYAIRNQKQSAARLHQNGRSDEVATTAAQPRTSTNMAYRTSAASLHSNVNQRGANGGHQTLQLEMHQPALPKQSHPEPGTNQYFTLGEGQAANQNVQPLPLASKSNVMRTHPASMQRNDDANEDYLDHDPDTLLNMQYQTLRAEPFDVSPGDTIFQLPPNIGEGSLDEKLNVVSNMSPNEQVEFFSSLALDDWEQAGDWFIGRFSGMLDKLKSARREKRAAASIFEEEVERRYNAVSHKRRQTDAQLDKMKESGGRVLQGTPKRTKAK